MLITACEGAAYRAGVREGDRLLKINGQVISDVLDYRFYSYDSRLTLTLLSPDNSERDLTLSHQEGGSLGLTFKNYLMDKERRCANKCIFCFIDQNPKGCRKSLYFKDDDARLSFLLGNYITLTNLTENEIARIIKMRISPLGISVHTTNPDLRVKMLGNHRAAACYSIMQRFAENGIRMNAQIVLCPGNNDKHELSRTLKDLSALGEAVSSVSIVPVGITKHRAGLHLLSPVTKQDAVSAICEASAFPRVWCSDEMYIRAELPFPDVSFYEEFPQFENGVGTLPLFLDEWQPIPQEIDIPAQTIVTGHAAAPFLETLLNTVPNVRVIAADNNFFGNSVDVAGLLTGGDILSALRDIDIGCRVLIPQNTLRHGEDCFLDDMTLPELVRNLKTPVIPVSPDADSLRDALLKNSPY